MSTWKDGFHYYSNSGHLYLNFKVNRREEKMVVQNKYTIKPF